VTTFRTLTRATAVILGVLASAVAVHVPSPAAAPALPTLTDSERGDMLSDVELTRAAIQVRRQALVTAVMDLDAKEAEAFWPLYRDYRAAMATVNDRYVKLVVTYLDTYDKLADDAAIGMLNEYLGIERARTDVKGQFVPQFGKVLPARKVARFFQIDNKLDAVIAADMAKLIPLAR